MFDATLLELVEIARRAGLRVSPAESMDAIAAASAVGLADRETLRAALGATLVKRREDRAIFDRTFDAFFSRQAEPSGDREEREELARRIAAAASPGSGGGLAALIVGGAELEARIEAALGDVGIGEIQSSMQIGMFTLRALERLGIEEASRALDELEGELAASAAAALDGLRRRVRARVRAELERQSPDRLRRNRADRLARAALAALTKDEVEQVASEVMRLGRVLRDRMERQRRRARRGRLDVRATVRRSLRSGGIPFAPVLRKRRRDRPKLVVLCDVSDSVRAAARFLLVLVHAMQEAFARTRSFVFVRDLGEATPLFERHDASEAIVRAFSGEVVSVAANSDYGRTLGQLVDRHLDAIDHRTTVVVLGDARSNYLDPNVEALATVHRRAARVVWLNPEPRASWGFGDSEMHRYLPFCALAATVRSLHELEHAVERLATIVNR